MVPVERIELPTFGLQNRCSTAELNRQAIGARRKYPPRRPIFGGSNTRLVRKELEPQHPLSRTRNMKKAAFQTPFPLSSACSLAEMPAAVLAAEPRAGDTDKTVAAGIGGRE